MKATRDDKGQHYWLLDGAIGGGSWHRDDGNRLVDMDLATVDHHCFLPYISSRFDNRGVVACTGTTLMGAASCGCSSLNWRPGLMTDPQWIDTGSGPGYVPDPATLTPVRRVYDAVEAVRQAWVDNRGNAAHHERMKEIVTGAMPLLASALDRLAEEGGGE